MPAPLDVLPVADGVGLPWDVAVVDAVGAIAAARASCGDSFVVCSGGDDYLFTFSATGVESFYGLLEDAASKGVADYLMLRRKLPDEVFAGRRLLPSSLFRRDDVSSYLANLDHALDATEAELGERGSAELFALTRRLGHRMGLASWAGPGCADGEAFERLVRAFDVLDGSDAFVHPDAMAAIAVSEKRAERTALDEVVEVIEDAVEQHDSRSSSTPAQESSTCHRAGRSPRCSPLLNASVAPGLQRWAPDRWHRHRLADAGALASPMLVTAFGHGRHSCPAQPFSLSAMTMAMTRLLGHYDMTPTWDEYPRPVPAQIGGVARSANPCQVGYTRR